MAGMSVMEMIRSVTSPTGDDGEGRWSALRGRPETRAAALGALPAFVGLLVVLVLTLLGALAVPHAEAGVGEALGAGSALWLALGGAHLTLGAATITLTPLLGLAFLVWLARVAARRSLGGDEPPRVVAAWVGGYALVGLLALAISQAGPITPSVLSSLLPLVVVPVVGLLLAHGLPPQADPFLDRVPVTLRRAWRPGLHGAVLALALGALLVVVAVALGASRVWHVQSGLGAGWWGGVVVVLTQLAFLPNLGAWTLSFAAGPGFSLTAGAQTTWSQAEAGVLPMIPVLAAHPQSGPLPWVTHLLVLLPVGLGAWVGHRALQEVPRLSRTSTKLAVVLTSVGVTALVVGLVDVLGGGSLGAGRLADVGAPAPMLVLFLALEMGLGAFVVTAREWWLLRR